jgi:hypothetical protein
VKLKAFMGDSAAVQDVAITPDQSDVAIVSGTYTALYRFTLYGVNRVRVSVTNTGATVFSVVVDTFCLNESTAASETSLASLDGKLPPKTAAGRVPVETGTAAATTSSVELVGDSFLAIQDMRSGVFYLVGALAGLIFFGTFWHTFGRNV